MRESHHKFAVIVLLNVFFALFSLLDADTSFGEEAGLQSLCAEGDIEAAPAIFWGISFDFEQTVLKAFSVGTQERHLSLWLNEQGFSPRIKTGTKGFSGTAEDVSSAVQREKEGNLLYLRMLWRNAPIGRSVFSVSWATDENDCITEIYAQSLLFSL